MSQAWKVRGAGFLLPMAVLAGCERPSESILGPHVVAPAVSPNAVSAQSKAFRKQVTVAGIQQHLNAFQAIADANGGNRLLGSAGYDASVQYVQARMTAAGYSVSLQDVGIILTGDNTPPELQQNAPNSVTYTHQTDFETMTYSGSGEVTAAVTAVDLQLPSTGGSTSGCEASDFAGFPAGNIALLQRGSCTFRLKADNAIAAGASAVIIFNEGNTPDRMGANLGTLSAPQISKPVVSTTFALGQSFANTPGLVVRVKVDFFVTPKTVHNVIAESPGKANGSTVLLGATLHSLNSPGINAASGASTILEIAEEFARHDQSARNQMRFVWFAGGEGSLAYVNALTPAELARISLMLDFAQLGSPNYVRFVHDGDNSEGLPGSLPAGSGAVESVFLDFFSGAGQAVSPAPQLSFTNLVLFANAGIPVGGLFSGTSALKTPAEVATYGGTAGIAHDPCAFLPCDNINNISTVVLDQLSQAAAHATYTFSRRNFQKDPLSP